MTTDPILRAYPYLQCVDVEEAVSYRRTEPRSIDVLSAGTLTDDRTPSIDLASLTSKQGGEMSIKFLGQPFDSSSQLGRVLQAALKDDQLTDLWVVTAWAKRSGLSRIGDSLRAFRERGGTASAIVGIDEGGATLEGLELALELFDDVHVFHDPGTRTFHPKFYVIEGDQRAVAVVGSGNLTKGGLFTNYEAALALDLRKTSDSEEASLLEDLRIYYERLLASGDACRQLDGAALAKLLDNPRYRIESEAAQNKRGAAARADLASGAEATPSLFGGPVGGLASAPTPSFPLVMEDDDDDSAPPAVGTAAPAPLGEAADAGGGHPRARSASGSPSAASTSASQALLDR